MWSSTPPALWFSGNKRETPQAHHLPIRQLLRLRQLRVRKVNALEKDAFEILAPAAAVALGLMFPAIPGRSLDKAIFVAIKNGDLTAARHSMHFLAEHDLKIYTTQQPGDVTPIYPVDKNSGVKQPT